MGLKAKNSILRSYTVLPLVEDRLANVKIDIKAYDETFTNAYNSKGEDYIMEQLEKQLKRKEVREKVAEAMGLEEFKGALVTFYGEERKAEVYFLKDGRSQYNVSL